MFQDDCHQFRAPTNTFVNLTPTKVATLGMYLLTALLKVNDLYTRAESTRLLGAVASSGLSIILYM